MQAKKTDAERLSRMELTNSETVFMLRVPKGRSTLVETHLKNLIALMGLDDEADSIETQMPPGVLLKRLRTGRGMTQKALADLTGAAQARVSDWESGVRPIPPEAAKRLAEHFGVSIKGFLE